MIAQLERVEPECLVLKRPSIPKDGRAEPTDGPRPVALVVVYDAQLREALVHALRGHWMLVDQAADGLAALHALSRRAPNLVILDADVP